MIIVRAILMLLPLAVLLVVVRLATAPDTPIETSANLLNNKSGPPDISSGELDVAKSEESKIYESRDKNGTLVLTSESQKDTKVKFRNIYKWRDANGTIIVSSETPPDNVIVETFTFTTNQSQITDSNIANEPLNAGRKFSEIDLVKPGFSEDPMKVYTPRGLRELIQYSKQVGEKIELRGELLNELMEQL